MFVGDVYCTFWLKSRGIYKALLIDISCLYFGIVVASILVFVKTVSLSINTILFATILYTITIIKIIKQY